MSVLVTFPGRYGDILWALPAVRALSRRIGEPVDLAIAGEFRGLLPLLRTQPYLGNVAALADWGMSARTPPEGWQDHFAGRHDGVFHCGYRGWPARPLPFETLDCLDAQIQDPAITVIRDKELALDEPWITVDGPGPPVELAVGFTEAWFELKLGLMVSLDAQGALPPSVLITPPGSRWTTEVPPGTVAVHPSADWLEIARIIRNADRFFGDCSALHVLAVALGTPVVLMEPMEARHNPIFYPLGGDGPQVTLVIGGDGRPTFDARHCRDAIRAARTLRTP